LQEMKVLAGVTDLQKAARQHYPDPASVYVSVSTNSKALTIFRHPTWPLCHYCDGIQQWIAY